MAKKSKKPNGYWNIKENVLEAARSCSTRTEFCEIGGAYVSAKTHGWLPEIYELLAPPNSTNIKLTPEACAEEALKYQTRIAFKKGSNHYYHKALGYGIMDDICAHMRPVGHKYKRQHYVIIFKDGTGYAGLSKDNLARVGRHIVDSSNAFVSWKMMQGIPYEVFLFDDLVEYDSAGAVEEELIEYLEDLDLLVLNDAKAGGLGGADDKWNKDLSIAAAKTCKTRTEFWRRFPGPANHAHDHGYIDECLDQIPSLIESWPKERVLGLLQSCKTWKEFYKDNSSAYQIAWQNGWLDDCRIEWRRLTSGPDCAKIPG